MVYSVGGIEVIQRPILAPETDNGPPKNKFHYEGLQETSIVLPKGHQKKAGVSRPLPCDIRFDRDQKVELRDGTHIRVDIFRPADLPADAKIPAIVMWSPYGNHGVGFPNLEYLPYRACVPESRLSGYEKFEGICPADFVPRGYAIVNADSRGTWDSEGDMVFPSSQEGRDGADLVDWVGQQEWCTGKVGMAGNSWLARAIWFTASQQPKHLAAIAPWEGLSDFYRESFCRGGVPHTAFWAANGNSFRGRSKMEDPFTMLDRYPLVNAYWEDKRPDLSKITVPSYTLASYSTMLHVYGSCRGFREMDCKDKWLRFHPWQEWYDLYAETGVVDLAKFFDRYLKEEKNDWESTPRVRLSLLRMNEDPIIGQAEDNYPIPRTEYIKHYLNNATMSLDATAPKASTSVEYLSTSEGITTYDMKFTDATQLAGYPKLELYISCEDHDDMDLFIQLRKLDKDGNELSQINYPLHELQKFGVEKGDVPWVNIVRHLGPSGVLRASHREVDESKSTQYDPFHPHTRSDKIPKGTVVKLEIGIWPMGIAFEAGEGLRLCVSGHSLVLPEYPGLTEVQHNVGTWKIHTGGETASYLQVPRI